MIARAAGAALAILAGSLASSPAAAQPLPTGDTLDAPALQPVAPSLQDHLPPVQDIVPLGQPAAPPQQPPAPPWLGPPPPAGYVPWPMIFRDGAWRPFGGFAEVDPPAPTGRDPLYPTGITLGIGGLLTTALGIGLLAGAAPMHQVCGLSGCIGLPDREAQNYGAAVIAGGVTSAILGGGIAYFTRKGPPSARTSRARTAVGAVLTTVGVSVAASGLMNAAAPYADHAPIAGEVFPPNDFAQFTHSDGATVVFTLVSATFLAVGLPLWITGAGGAPPHGRRARDATDRLDLLPSAGGAALRWTR